MRVGPRYNDWCSYEREIWRETQTHRKKQAMRKHGEEDQLGGHGARYWSNGATSYGLPKIAGNH